MCGIVGFVDRRHTPDPALLRRMTATLQHRGPDGFGVRVEGAAALGHSRLAIIDLSSGDQPMADPSGRWWLVFNGEIFNYLELRAELEADGHRFHTTSDTEVLLRMLMLHG
ncbi:asparagine synthetase B, partial [bacterium]|nr:asparagine synthetase B [bacterium]